MLTVCHPAQAKQRPCEEWPVSGLAPYGQALLQKWLRRFVVALEEGELSRVLEGPAPQQDRNRAARGQSASQPLPSLLQVSVRHPEDLQAHRQEECRLVSPRLCQTPAEGGAKIVVLALQVAEPAACCPSRPYFSG